MVAVVAAVLFGLALLFALAGLALGPINSAVLITAGLLCIALHPAGVGNKVKVRSYRRRR